MKYYIKESSRHERVYHPDFLGSITETDENNVSRCVQFFSREDGKVTAKYHLEEKHLAFSDIPKSTWDQIRIRAHQKGWIPELA